MDIQVVLDGDVQILHAGMHLALDSLLAQCRKKRSIRFNQDAEVGVKCA